MHPIARISSLALAWVTGAAITACSDNALSFGNGEATKTIESLWNGEDVSLWIGEVLFVGPDFTSRPQWAAGDANLAELPMYRAFASRGLITLANDKDFSSEYHRSDWYRLIDKGVKRTATVSLTDLGRATGEIKILGDREILSIKVSTIRIDEIVANDSIVVGADRYRVILGTRTVDIPADFQDALNQATGDSIGRLQRFKILLKYDPFDTTWKISRTDIANRREDFRTANVDNRIAQLRF